MNTQTEIAASTAETTQSVTPATPEKPKVVVQQVSRASISEDEPAQKTALANGQQSAQTSNEPAQVTTQSPNKFILTPDYIQQSKFFS